MKVKTPVEPCPCGRQVVGICDGNEKHMDRVRGKCECGVECEWLVDTRDRDGKPGAVPQFFLTGGNCIWTSPSNYVMVELEEAAA